MSIITLTTDYGLKDHFVGALKGKILSEFSEAKIIDISHEISPFNTVEASYIISSAYSSFPKGTVHLIGVDAELNYENQHIAMLWNDQYFICADNGILSMLTQKITPEKIFNINIHDRLPVHATDLDVFVKVACHLAKGGLLNLVGKEITALKNVTGFEAIVSGDKNAITGYVIYIDHFGNLVTNITQNMFLEIGRGRNFEIPLISKKILSKSNPIKNIGHKYSDIASSGNYELKKYEGDKLAIFNEAGFLEIAIFRSNPSNVGSASSLLGFGYGDTITIQFLN
ncbi:MAG: S-adenosyl-l-methionine hydroxide adenosyltransferase family protein [Flavobacterium sp.]